MCCTHIDRDYILSFSFKKRKGEKYIRCVRSAIFLDFSKGSRKKNCANDEKPVCLFLLLARNGNDNITNKKRMQ